MADDSGSHDVVRAHFESDAEYWSAVYDSARDVAGLVYRQREQRALALIDQLGLESSARVADVGAGAGRASVALAERGFDVISVDASANMLELIRARAARAGVTLEIVQADAVQLPLAAGSVDVVVALGLLPWVNDPAAVLAECSRVLVPGGSLIVSADNRWRLVEFLDPKLSPFANPLRRAVGPLVRAMRGRQSAEFAVHRHSPDELRRLLVAAGLHPGSIETVGYGPVMLMRKPILEGAAGLKLARGLSFAAARFKPLAKLGVHVLAHATTQRDGEPPWP